LLKEYGIKNDSYNLTTIYSLTKAYNILIKIRKDFKKKERHFFPKDEKIKKQFIKI